MIEIGSKKNKYTYNAYHIVKSFFPGEEIIQKVDEKQEPLVAVRLPFPLHRKKSILTRRDSGRRKRTSRRSSGK